MLIHFCALEATKVLLQSGLVASRTARHKSNRGISCNLPSGGPALSTKFTGRNLETEVDAFDTG